jgi:hypothetical protein
MVMYVKDFDFKKTACDMSASKQNYAKGGHVYDESKGGAKNMPRDEMPKKAMAPARRSVPVAPTGALLALKKGGMAKGGMHKMPDGKMMKNSAMKTGGSVKAGGPACETGGKNSKQAVVMAMSEGRKGMKS